MYQTQYLDQLKLRLKASKIVLDIPACEEDLLKHQLKRIDVTNISSIVSSSMDILVTSKYTQYKSCARNLIDKGFKPTSVINSRFTNHLQTMGNLDFSAIMFALRNKKSIIHLSKLKEFLLSFDKSSRENSTIIPESTANLTVQLVDLSGIYNSAMKLFNKTNSPPQLYMNSLKSPFLNITKLPTQTLSKKASDSISNKRIKLTEEERQKLDWEDLYVKDVKPKNEGQCYICGIYVNSFTKHINNAAHKKLTAQVLPKFSLISKIFEMESPLNSSSDVFSFTDAFLSANTPNSLNSQNSANSVNSQNEKNLEFKIGENYSYFDGKKKTLHSCSLLQKDDKTEKYKIRILKEDLNKNNIFKDVKTPQSNKVEDKKVDKKFLFGNSVLGNFDNIRIDDFLLIWIDNFLGVQLCRIIEIRPDKNWAFSVCIVKTDKTKAKRLNLEKERKIGVEKIKINGDNKIEKLFNKNTEDFRLKLKCKEIEYSKLEGLIKAENLLTITLNEIRNERAKVIEYKNEAF